VRQGITHVVENASDVHLVRFWVLTANVTSNADRQTLTVQAGDVVTAIVSVVLPVVSLGRTANAMQPVDLQGDIADLIVTAVMGIV
jgi:hypothetical protein